MPISAGVLAPLAYSIGSGKMSIRRAAFGSLTVFRHARCASTNSSSDSARSLGHIMPASLPPVARTSAVWRAIASVSGTCA
jgi:hypothetical protein